MNCPNRSLRKHFISQRKRVSFHLLSQLTITCPKTTVIDWHLLNHFPFSPLCHLCDFSEITRVTRSGHLPAMMWKFENSSGKFNGRLCNTRFRFDIVHICRRRTQFSHFKYALPQRQQQRCLSSLISLSAADTVLVSAAACCAFASYSHSPPPSVARLSNIKCNMKPQNLLWLFKITFK